VILTIATFTDEAENQQNQENRFYHCDFSALLKGFWNGN
jgi:hypothetical protein